MRNPAAAGLMNFCWVSNVAIVFEVIFFINVNSDDLIFDFSVSRHRETSADLAGFPIFFGNTQNCVRILLPGATVLLKKGQQNSFHVEA